MAKKAAKKVTKKVSKKATKKVTKKVTKKIAPKAVKRESAEVIKPLTLSVGESAPEFTLEDQNGKKVSLKDFRGQKVLVYFYPKALTPGCTTQACSLSKVESKLHQQNIVVLGISPDAAKLLKKFEEKQSLNITLLSDPEHRAASAYHCWGLKKFMGREYMGILRQSFLLDENGKIVHIMHKVNTSTHHDEVLQIFKSLG